VLAVVVTMVMQMEVMGFEAVWLQQLEHQILAALGQKQPQHEQVLVLRL
jgi:hypothetical protein